MRALSLAEAKPETVRVWDPFIRVFHWTLVVSFFAAYFFTEEGDPPHEIAGYIALGLVAARIVWGFIGTKHARFVDFVASLRALFAYVRDVLARRESRYLGHNPAGAVMVVALLGSVAATGITGWMLTTDAFWGVEWVEELHEILATATLVMVGLHVAGVVYESIHQRENLVLAMFTGRKRG